MHLLLLLLLLLIAFTTSAPLCAVPPALREKCGHQELLKAPVPGQRHGDWLHAIQAWRASCLVDVRYNGTIFQVLGLRVRVRVSTGDSVAHK